MIDVIWAFQSLMFEVMPTYAQQILSQSEHMPGEER